MKSTSKSETSTGLIKIFRYYIKALSKSIGLFIVLTIVLLFLAVIFYKCTYLTIYDSISLSVGIGALILTGIIAIRQDLTLDQLKEDTEKANSQLSRGRREYAIEQRAARFFRLINSSDKLEYYENKLKAKFLCLRLEKDISDFSVTFTPSTEDFLLNVITQMLTRCQATWITASYENEKECSELSKDENIYATISFYNSNNILNNFKNYPLRFIKNSIGIIDLTKDIGGKVFSEIDESDEIVLNSYADRKNLHYGIISRFLKDGKPYFILTGINQLGIRVAGLFLERMIIDEKEKALSELHINAEEYEILINDKSFTAIIVGTFKNHSLEVQRLDCQELWMHTEEDKWDIVGKMLGDQHLK